LLFELTVDCRLDDGFRTFEREVGREDDDREVDREDDVERLEDFGGTDDDDGDEDVDVNWNASEGSTNDVMGDSGEVSVKGNDRVNDDDEILVSGATLFRRAVGW
jgi:hypothetical protein